MDALAEANTFERLRSDLDGRSALLISHRFSTVRTADHIVVLDNGRIAEDGTHRDLLAARGMYAHLFETQAAGYR
jgi:ATP-binding cassette, subfamily B, bacterial